jgi:hypothetical protein
VLCLSHAVALHRADQNALSGFCRSESQSIYQTLHLALQSRYLDILKKTSQGRSADFSMFKARLANLENNCEPLLLGMLVRIAAVLTGGSLRCARSCLQCST